MTRSALLGLLISLLRKDVNALKRHRRKDVAPVPVARHERDIVPFLQLKKVVSNNGHIDLFAMFVGAGWG